MTAKEYLSEVQRLQNDIELEQRELQSVRDAATRITASYSGVKVHSNSHYDKVADNATKIADLESEIVTDIEQLFALKHRIINQIQGLGNINYVNVLYFRYVELNDFFTIAEQMNYTYQYVVFLHGKALKAFEKQYQDILKGGESSAAEA